MIKKLVTAVSVLFLLVGATLLFFPRISNQIEKQKIHSIIERFEEIKNDNAFTEPSEPTEPTAPAKSKSDQNNVTSEPKKESIQNDSSGSTSYRIDVDRLYRDSMAYNEKLKNNQYDLLIDESSYQNAALNLYDYGVPDNVYGYISAPSIDMELPIYLGANADTMSYGAAHLTYTSLPTGGESTNCVLAAHTGYIGKLFFDNIPYFNIGDEIIVTNYWNKLSYQVVDKHVYKKYESGNCYIDKGKDLLTLITCANGGTERFYVTCERK